MVLEKLDLKVVIYFLRNKKNNKDTQELLFAETKLKPILFIQNRNNKNIKIPYYYLIMQLIYIAEDYYLLNL